ncbi:NAD(P)/FAD-dependent oxidoreductase [Rhodococcus sp. LB1]|uniref:NAD(P)/FAD-dependent oxidoreductase n=1 Tax=Rhodococcus sp. LB1 TaxID=1807499 RepID=UPI0007C659F0|nr:FAD-dependent oxidoreductase [Rhodococcus sp. LB1]
MMGAAGQSGVLIVGGGHAGVQIAASLREAGYADRITLVNGEPHRPYDRPSLSKEALDDASAAQDFSLRGEDFFASRGIDMVQARVARLDRDSKSVVAQDGREWRYEHLVLATGGRPRRLPVPGAELAGVAELRSLDDARALRVALEAATNIVIIGGGFIGLEVAAAAAARQRHVTVIEGSDRLMKRVVTPHVSEIVADYHRSCGVELHFDDRVTEIRGRGGVVGAVLTAEGEELAADLVVLGVGMVANDELAAAAGLPTDHGILVDQQMRTRDRAIFAIGDCAAVEDESGRVHRLESIQSATDQARHVATTILGNTDPYSATPWFWSNQGALKVQIVGVGNPGDRTVVRREGNRLSVFCLRHGRLVAIESVNDPGTHMVGRRILERGEVLDEHTLADGDYDLRQVAKRAVRVGGRS